MINSKKSSFWSVYIIISIIFTLFFAFIEYRELVNNKNRYIQSLSNFNRIISQNTLAALRYQESTLKILGKNLLSIDAYNYPEVGRRIIEEMIEVNKGLVAFGLARYNGQLILVSTLPKGTKLPNLMKNEKTKHSFVVARDSSTMQIGRTYHMKTLKQWVIPIRIAIKNQDGKVPLVMTAGIKIDGGDTSLNVKELPKNILIQVVRKDRYIQFQNPIIQTEYNKTYNNKVYFDVFDKLKSGDNQELIVFDSQLTNKKSLTISTYMKEFDFYTVVSIPYKNIYESFFSKFYISIILLVLLLLSLYFVFKHSITLQKKAQKNIESFNEDLKQKVKDRTIELEDTITNLKATQNRLIESEKMASLGGLVAGVAHEINTPVGISLTGITYFSEINRKIKKNYEDNNVTEEEFKKFLEISNELAHQITANLNRTAQLVRSFKQVAVDQSSEIKREFDVKEYIKEVLLSLENITKKTNLSIEVNSKEYIVINSYAGTFSQIITNLIINSIKHGYNSGEKGTISIDISKNKNFIKIIFKDDGKGISKTNIKKIFEPFFTTNRKEGGTGLGLNIIYNIITRQLKGSIDCVSTEGEGAMFLILIPINENKSI